MNTKLRCRFIKVRSTRELSSLASGSSEGEGGGIGSGALSLLVLFLFTRNFGLGRELQRALIAIRQAGKQRDLNPARTRNLVSDDPRSLVSLFHILRPPLPPLPGDTVLFLLLLNSSFLSCASLPSTRPFPLVFLWERTETIHTNLFTECRVAKTKP